jgi:hypothetical protein
LRCLRRGSEALRFATSPQQRQHNAAANAKIPLQAPSGAFFMPVTKPEQTHTSACHVTKFHLFK